MGFVIFSKVCIYETRKQIGIRLKKRKVLNREKNVNAKKMIHQQQNHPKSKARHRFGNTRHGETVTKTINARIARRQKKFMSQQAYIKTSWKLPKNSPVNGSISIVTIETMKCRRQGFSQRLLN